MRIDVLTAILRSAEFDFRYVQLAPFVPRDVQLCSSPTRRSGTTPTGWRSSAISGFSTRKLDMHRKDTNSPSCYSVCISSDGCVAMPPSFVSAQDAMRAVLAGQPCRARYSHTCDEQWADRAQENARVLENAASYAPFHTEDQLTFLRMDGRRLAFADETFDVAYSLSSISTSAASMVVAAIDEMTRIIKPAASW